MHARSLTRKLPLHSVGRIGQHHICFNTRHDFTAVPVIDGDPRVLVIGFHGHSFFNMPPIRPIQNSSTPNPNAIPVLSFVLSTSRATLASRDPPTRA